MTNKRRIIIITVSVFAGTLLSAWLTVFRKDKLTPTDYSTLFINMLLALAIIIGIGVILRKKKDD